MGSFGLLPVRGQAITWNNAESESTLSIRDRLQWNFNRNRKIMHSKTFIWKCRPFCSGLNVLIRCSAHTYVDLWPSGSGNVNHTDSGRPQHQDIHLNASDINGRHHNKNNNRSEWFDTYLGRLASLVALPKGDAPAPGIVCALYSIRWWNDFKWQQLSNHSDLAVSSHKLFHSHNQSFVMPGRWSCHSCAAYSVNLVVNTATTCYS